MVQWLFHQTRLGPVAHFIASVGATAERSRVRRARRLIKASPNAHFVKELHGHFAHFVKRPNLEGLENP